MKEKKEPEGDIIDHYRIISESCPRTAAPPPPPSQCNIFSREKFPAVTKARQANVAVATLSSRDHTSHLAHMSTKQLREEKNFQLGVNIWG